MRLGSEIPHRRRLRDLDHTVGDYLMISCVQQTAHFVINLDCSPFLR
jgi:hypothetical protein